MSHPLAIVVVLMLVLVVVVGVMVVVVVVLVLVVVVVLVVVQPIGALVFRLCLHFNLIEPFSTLTNNNIGGK